MEIYNYKYNEPETRKENCNIQMLDVADEMAIGKRVTSMDGLTTTTAMTPVQKVTAATSGKRVYSKPIDIKCYI